jgi:hypothetical protein
MIALDWPLVDAHNTRQCQTAILTENMMAEGGLPLAARADWKGDETGQLLLEMPFYNWAALGVAHLVGNLDMAGKLVSIAFWALAFWLNHLLMRRVLTPTQSRWGDLLFALSPLSIFFGQAFQPEMLIMVLALGIVLSFLRHQQTGSMGWFAICVALSLVAVTVKANEVSHLFVLIGILAFAKEGWPCLLKLRYWIFVALLALVSQTYGTYLTEVNSISFPEWTTEKNLQGFLGKKGMRLNWHPYLRSASYVIFLVFTPAATAIAAAGVLRIFRKRRARLYLLWTLSLVFFYLVWGPGTSFAHSYYNLPTLPVACALFGIGASVSVAWIRGFVRRRRQTAGPVTHLCSGRKLAAWTSAGIVLLLTAGSVWGSVVLFWPDRSARDGAAALRGIVAGRKGLVLCYPNHTAYSPGYIHYTTLFYCASVCGWNENPKWTASHRTEVLGKCRWVIELHYNSADQTPLRNTTIFSNRPRRLLNTQVVRENSSFKKMAETPRYTIWERFTPAPVQLSQP